MFSYKHLKKGMMLCIILILPALFFIRGELTSYSATYGTQSAQNIMQGAALQAPACSVLPANASLILRIDDAQAFAWNTIVRNLTDAANRKGMPVVLGVIPKDIGQDPVIRKYLLNKIRGNKIEVALHGTRHTEAEYGNLTETEAHALIKEGLEELYAALKVYPTTFIPPGLKYSDGATKALSMHGIRTISAGKDEYNFSGNILLAGYTMPAKLPGNTSRVDEVLYECENALMKRNLCVILVHPQDYALEDMISLNENAYAEYITLLQGLEKTGAKFVLFRDLLK